MTNEEIVCKIRDEYDTLMKNRDLTRVDILNAFDHLTLELTKKVIPAQMNNCMRVYFRRHKNAVVESIACYTIISMGHIGNNHYRILYNENGYEKTVQIDKFNLIRVEGI